MSRGSLTFTFAESGRGETIYIEFPTGEIGVVDGSKTSSGCRAALVDELKGREIAFVCLTHPHKDHGDDLIDLIKSRTVPQFWHSLPEVEPFIYFVTQGTRFRSFVSHLAQKAQIERAQFVLDLWTAIKCRRVECLSFDGSRESIDIGDVSIHFLAPDRAIISHEMTRLQNCLISSKSPPDPNVFSLVIAIEYRQTLTLLGADGLKQTWVAAHKKWRKKKLPRAVVLKVPHHGARNAFDLRPAKQRGMNCWDLCVEHPEAVIFAGDYSHPDPVVYSALSARSNLHSFFDLAATSSISNPLGLHTPGARAMNKNLRTRSYCKIECEITDSGTVQVRKF